MSGIRAAIAGSIRRAALALCLVLCALAPARAQQPGRDPAEADREAEYYALFAQGLETLGRRDLATAERLFLRCIELFPDLPTSYYNVACACSLGNRVDDAVRYLNEAFRRGFHDLAHIGRDPDLDPIRRAPAFRAALAELEATLLRGLGEPLGFVPEGDKVPLLVLVHDQRANPRRDFDALRRALPRVALLVPQGIQQREGFLWDERAEWVVVRAVRAFLQANQAVDPRAVFLFGQGFAGAMALDFTCKNRDLFQGVLACGPNLGRATDDAEGTPLRAYLVVADRDEEQVRSGEEARDALVETAWSVVLERHPVGAALGQDNALLVRATAWLQGQPATLPGAGTEVRF